MKKIYLIIILLVSLFLSCRSAKPLNCNQSLQELEDYVKNHFSADSVLIIPVSLKEEIYFEKIDAVNVIVYDGQSDIYDFKELPNDKYQRIEHFSIVEKSFKDKCIPIFNKLKQNCNTNGFDEIYFEFGKRLTAGDILIFHLHFSLKE